MKSLTRIAASSGRAAIGVGVLVAAGVLAVGTATVVAEPLPTHASAGDRLQSFDSCSALRQWYVDGALGDVGPYGWSYRYGVLRANAAGDGPPGLVTPQATAPDRAVGSSPTGTNTQETGVDEPDTAKTDGRLLVRVVGASVVVSDVTGDQPVTVSTYPLTGFHAPELLLVGDRVVVLDTSTRPVTVLDDVHPIGTATGGSRVLTLDLADPSTPRPVADRTFSGSTVTARQYGGVVRLVSRTERPALPFVRPRSGGLGYQAATEQNREIVRASRLQDWQPTVRDTDSPVSSATPLVPCTDVLHPPDRAGDGTVTVVGFDPAQPEALSTSAVTTGGDLVYSSPDTLYLATSESTEGLLSRAGRLVGRPARSTTHTVVHAFTLAGTAASYVATGTVGGSVRDRWSMDAHDGRLRLALRTGVGADNAIVTLRREGHRLVESGRVDDLGRGEEIRSVRWFDDLAVLVTFRQMDPLYTVDLTDADHPRLAGELKIPGFSGYLHPIGDHRLLGLGTDATPDGRSLGALVQVFDLTDLAHPAQVDRLGLGPQSYLTAPDDARSFTWLPDTSTGLTQVVDAGGRIGSGLARIRVNDEGRLAVSRESLPETRGWGAMRTLPLPDGRVLLVADQGARTISGG